MFHRVGIGKHANSLSMLRSHFEYLKEHFEIVLPGDPLSKKKYTVCLTFDDATFDFYHFVFPLLKELDLRVVLGVPVRYITERTLLSAEERLNIPYPLMMQDGFFDQKAPFCTWEELLEMTQSGYVEVASHSFSHANVTFPFVNLEKEIVFSKKILEEKLQQVISTFIYPFGRHNKTAHQIVTQHYSYAFRIGSAYNYNWKSEKNPLCRIPADNLGSPQALFSFSKKCTFFFKTAIKK